jgi:hypothetical protein
MSGYDFRQGTRVQTRRKSELIHMALKNNFDVIVELEAPLRVIEDLTGFRLWHDLQQRVGPDRELPDERPVMR